MSEWISYDMIVGEIRLHRDNAERRIEHYRELKKERKLNAGEQGLYDEAVGQVVELLCLEQWCKDMKFSIDDLKDLDEYKIEGNGEDK